MIRYYEQTITENETRWIGLYWAVRAVITSIVVLIELACDEKNESEQAEYVYYELTDIKNLALLHYIGDIQSTMAQSFVLLQKQFVFVGKLTDHSHTLQLRIGGVSDWETKGWYLSNFIELIESNKLAMHGVTIGKIEDASTIESIQTIMDQACILLQNNIKVRFKNSDLIDATRVLMPSFWKPFIRNEKEAKNHGKEQLKILLSKWGDLLDVKMANAEFDMIKLELIDAAKQKLSLLQFWTRIWEQNKHVIDEMDSQMENVEINENLSVNSDNNCNDELEYPNLSILAFNSCGISHTSTGCERGYAVLNHLKSKKRNALKLTTTSNCMHAAINGPEYYEEFDFMQAFNIFESKKSKRGRYALKPKQNIVTHPIKPKANK